MADTRKKDYDWRIGTNDNGTTPTEHVKFALLMDIRDELKRLNNLLHCHNFTTIPIVLRGIRRNTTKKRRVKK